MKAVSASVRAICAVGLALALASGMSYAQEDQRLIIVTDIVYGHENSPEGRTCTANNRFTPEQQIVWRTKVIDPATGQEMGDDQLESVTVVMPDGQQFEMEFGPHPARAPVDDYWTYDWIIPADYPTGIVDYAVEAVDVNGRTGQFVMFPIEASMLTIVPE